VWFPHPAGTVAALPCFAESAYSLATMSRDPQLDKSQKLSCSCALFLWLVGWFVVVVVVVVLVLVLVLVLVVLVVLVLVLAGAGGVGGAGKTCESQTKHHSEIQEKFNILL